MADTTNPAMVTSNPRERKPLCPVSRLLKYGNILLVTLLNPNPPTCDKMVAIAISTCVNPICSDENILGESMARLINPITTPR
jgi:hypothetical protein